MSEIAEPNEELDENSKDQTERAYYYDDACGYEVYVDEDAVADN